MICVGDLRSAVIHHNTRSPCVVQISRHYRTACVHQRDYVPLRILSVYIRLSAVRYSEYSAVIVDKFQSVALFYQVPVAVVRKRNSVFRDSSALPVVRERMSAVTYKISAFLPLRRFPAIRRRVPHYVVNEIRSAVRYKAITLIHVHRVFGIFLFKQQPIFQRYFCEFPLINTESLQFLYC